MSGQVSRDDDRSLGDRPRVYSHDKFVWFFCKLCKRNFKKKEDLIQHRKMEHLQLLLERQRVKDGRKREIEIQIQVKGSNGTTTTAEGLKPLEKVIDKGGDHAGVKVIPKWTFLTPKKIPPNFPPALTIPPPHSSASSSMHTREIWPPLTIREAWDAVRAVVTTSSSNAKEIKVPSNPFPNFNLVRQTTLSQDEAALKRSQELAKRLNLTANVGSLSITLMPTVPPPPQLPPTIQALPPPPLLAASVVAKPCATVQPQPHTHPQQPKLPTPTLSKQEDRKPPMPIIYMHKCDVCSLRYKDYDCLMEHKKQHSPSDWREYLVRENEKNDTLKRGNPDPSTTEILMINQSKIFEKMSNLERVVNQSVKRDEVKGQNNQRVRKGSAVQKTERQRDGVKSKGIINGVQRKMNRIFKQVKRSRGRPRLNMGKENPEKIAGNAKQMSQNCNRMTGEKTEGQKRRGRRQSKVSQIKQEIEEEDDPLAIFEKPDVIPEQEWPYFDTSGRIYCVCNDLAYGPMICCDNNEKCPKEWFHFACVGVTSDENIGEWFCPPCTKEREGKASAVPSTEPTGERVLRKRRGKTEPQVNRRETNEQIQKLRRSKATS